MSYFPDPKEMTLSALIFMLITYGYTLYRAADFIGEGSEMLLLIYGPGIIGGILLPIVGVLPDCIIIIVSGSGGGSQEEIQDEVSVGVGSLLGSTIALLTLRYSLSVYFGLRDIKHRVHHHRHSLEQAHVKQKKLTKLSLIDSGVALLNEVPVTSRIMLISLIGYLIIQIPALIFKSKYDEREYIIHEKPFILASMIVSFLLFLIYCVAQYINAKTSQITRLRQENLRRITWKSNLDKRLSSSQYQEFIFRKHDRDNSGYIDPNELKDALKDMGLIAGRQTMKYILDIVDIGNEDDGDAGVKDGKISLNEFKAAVNIWMKEGNSGENFDEKMTNAMEKDETLKTLKGGGNDLDKNLIVSEKEEEGEKEDPATYENKKKPLVFQHSIHDDEEDDEEHHHIHLTDNQLIRKAIAMIIYGTFLCTIFSEPTVGVISYLSKKLEINSFFVSFVLAPLVLNSREIFASIPLAKKKTSNSISLILYSLNGAVTMNNTLALGIFMAVIYTRNLPWSYSAEVIVLICVTIYVGLNSLMNTIRFWQSIIITLIYPLSILAVYLIKKYGGLD